MHVLTHVLTHVLPSAAASVQHLSQACARRSPRLQHLAVAPQVAEQQWILGPDGGVPSSLGAMATVAMATVAMATAAPVSGTRNSSQRPADSAVFICLVFYSLYRFLVTFVLSY